MLCFHLAKLCRILAVLSLLLRDSAVLRDQRSHFVPRIKSDRPSRSAAFWMRALVS